jgi:oligoribonuclease
LAPLILDAAAEKAHIPELDFVLGFDIESSGLGEQTDQVLEVAAIFGSFRNGEFVEATRLQRVLPLQSNIEDWHEAVLEMHTKNGLLAEAVALTKRLRVKPGGCDDYRFDLDKQLALTASVRPKDRKWTLLGNSVHFDLRFVWRLFPELSKHVSHRVIDVSSIRLFCEMLGRPYVEGEAAHRAMADVEASLDLLQEYRKWVTQDLPQISVARALGVG